MSQSSSDTSSFVDESWISWFCGLAGNQFFCEIDKSYIDDAFNLFGLKQHFPKDYNKALDTILDRIGPSETESEELSRSAALLFGLIHARYIVTSHGLEVMHRKFVLREFGECPRTYCRGQAALPMGFTDEPRHGAVKLFCPRCQDVYNCQSSQRHIDGAFFGPTFPNLFMMSFDELVPEPPIDRYVPRIFGFKIHSSSRSLPVTKGRVHRGGASYGGSDILAVASAGTGSVENGMQYIRTRESPGPISSQNVPSQGISMGTELGPFTSSAALSASYAPVAGSGKRNSMLLTRLQAEARYRERLANVQHMQLQTSHDNVGDDDDGDAAAAAAAAVTENQSCMIGMSAVSSGAGSIRGPDSIPASLTKKRLLPLTEEQIAQHNSTILQTETETGTGTETGTELTMSGMSVVASWLSRQSELRQFSSQDPLSKKPRITE